jgi:acyl-CoA ligase (AMP-forming) (exosortase A-associated)
MTDLLHNLIRCSANRVPEQTALKYKNSAYTYAELALEVEKTAAALLDIGLARDERIAIYLPKLPETVVSFFAASHAGGVFVPVNPLLKGPQVSYILSDCNVRILITSRDRYEQLKEILPQCHDLHTIVLVNCEPSDLPDDDHRFNYLTWGQLREISPAKAPHRRIDADMAAILYTSGSTGKPKGVVLSHKNMVAGARSVSEYLQNSPEDRLLAVLPFSFDYGFSQLSTAFHSGATTVLMDYLLPRDVVKMVAKERITGLAGVPPLWNQLAELEWPQETIDSLRYMTNSGGAMPKTTLAKLRASLPKSKFFLMYGLTEAFRSTYLPPEEIDRRPDSMGKAIPNAEIMVVREDGSPCAPGEPGELVHRGALVSMGYWNDVQKTAERFKPVPGQNPALTLTEVAVWSGDTVKMDDEGYLYFVARRDEMIKTSGYRVSPTEVEEVVYASELVGEVVALGIPHPTLGQAIVLVATPNKEGELNAEEIITHCKKELPNFMTPHAVERQESLPRNPNGKIDRKALSALYQEMFSQ